MASLLFAAFGAWLFYIYAFHLEDAPEGSRRGAWFMDLLRSNNGAPGIIFGAILAVCCGWWTFIAGWRFFSPTEAVVLTGQGLLLHPSYRRTGEIPFEEVVSASVGEENPGAWFFKRHDLRIEFTNRRRVLVRSIEVEGGKPELRAFAAALDARRKPGAVKNGASHE